jgi:hypothetical protein
MYAIPLLAVLAALVLFAGSRTVEADIRKQERSQSGAAAADLTAARG